MFDWCVWPACEGLCITVSCNFSAASDLQQPRAADMVTGVIWTVYLLISGYQVVTPFPSQALWLLFDSPRGCLYPFPLRTFKTIFFPLQCNELFLSMSIFAVDPCGDIVLSQTILSHAGWKTEILSANEVTFALHPLASCILLHCR